MVLVYYNMSPWSPSLPKKNHHILLQLLTFTSSSSSSVMGSQSVVVATAMALSGTVILIALRLQKSLPLPSSSSSPPILRSCISSERKKGHKKNKKRVHFAEDVVDSRSDGEEFRRKHRVINNSVFSNSETKMTSDNRGMPANRVALYKGILRDRVAQRVAYSY